MTSTDATPDLEARISAQVRRDAKRRNRVRRSLRRQGLSDAYIERRIALLIEEQQAYLSWMRSAAAEPWRPSDAGYRPRPPDSLLTGAARVTGATARAVRRRNATTLHEHQATDR